MPFVKGDPRINREGRPKGSLSFATKWKKFIEKVAEDNGLTPEEIDEQLYKVAWQKAKEGDYQFYRDIHDRVYGKPQLNVDHTTAGKELPTPILDYVSSNNSDKTGDGDGSKD